MKKKTYELVEISVSSRVLSRGGQLGGATSKMTQIRGGAAPPRGPIFFRAFGAIFIQYRVLCIRLEALWNDLPPEADFFLHF